MSSSNNCLIINHTCPVNVTAATTETTEEPLLKLCERSVQMCTSIGLEAIFMIVNSICIIINIIHMTILSKIESLRNTPYYSVLKTMALSDIIGSMANIVRLLCIVHKHSDTLAVAIGVSAGSDSAAGWRYYIIGWACFERYMAVCRPFEYRGNPLVANIGKVMWISLVWTLANAITRDIIFLPALCMDTVLGASNNAGSIYASLYTWVFGSLPLILAFMFSALILIELRRMRKRTLSNQQREVNAAAKYILTTNGVLCFCLLPYVIYFAMSSLSAPDQNLPYTEALSWLSPLVFGLYGTLNTIVYGWKNKAYQNIARRMVGCRPSEVDRVLTAENNTT